MEATDVAPALQARLGVEATEGLLRLFDTARQEWLPDVTEAAVERFERRLTEEIAGVRVAMSQLDAGLRLVIRDGDQGLRLEVRQGDEALRMEIREGNAALRLDVSEAIASLRQEMREGDAALQQQMRDGDAALRQEMRDLTASLRQEILTVRFELVKWSFAFWIGQVVATAGIIGVMFRLVR